MIRPYLTRTDSRLQQEDTRWGADRVPVPHPAGWVQCHGAAALLDPPRGADLKAFPSSRVTDGSKVYRGLLGGCAGRPCFPL